MKIKCIFLIISLLLFSTCINKVDFESSEKELKLVINGSINTSWGPHQIRLSRTNDFGIQSVNPEIGADVLLFDENGPLENFNEISPGIYQIDYQKVKGESGKSYHIEVELSNGKSYQSNPETLPDYLGIDTLRAEVNHEDYLNSIGNVIENDFVNVYAQTQIPDWENGPYIRWDLENIWQLTEVSCSPLHSPKTCYMTYELNKQDILLVDGTDKIPNTFYEEKVSSKILGIEYNQRQSYRVFQKSLTKKSFQYWTKLDRVINQVGTIFDTPPAAVQGNVFNTDDETEQVFGYFEAIAEDTTFIIVAPYNLDLNEPLTPYCSTQYYNYRRPPECCNCLTLENSSVIRPDFWD